MFANIVIKIRDVPLGSRLRRPPCELYRYCKQTSEHFRNKIPEYMRSLRYVGFFFATATF